MATRLINHKIVAGTQTVSTVNSATAIRSFTLQSDQTQMTRWIPPVYPPTTPPKRAVYAEYEDESQRGHGYYQFQWVFTYWTFGQLSYWRTQFLPSNAESAAVTVLTYDEHNTAIYLTCVLKNPHVDQGLTIAVGGYSNVILRFTKGVVIT